MASDTPTRPLRFLLILLCGAVLGALGAALLLPPGSSVGGVTTGDQTLAAQVRALIGDGAGFRSLAIARVTKDRTTFAGLGSPGDGIAEVSPTTRFPFGSITKTFNGLLLADAVKSRQVRLDEPVGEILPELAGTPVGAVTLQELATHRAGLPHVLPSESVGGLFAAFSLRDPYSIDVPGFLAEVRTITPSGRGQRSYSNVGASLLGHALARVFKAPDWPSLVRSRIFEPLGMRDTTFAATDADVPVGAVPEWTANGRRAAHWTTSGQAPAGASTWTTAADLGRYAQAILAGRAPGLTALDPVADRGDDKQGLHWVITDVDGHTITWHNGGVGGARTFLGIDRSRGEAILVLGNTDRDVDPLAIRLLTGDAQPLGTPLPWVGIAFLVLFAGLVVWQGLRAGRPVSRAKLLSQTMDAATLLLLARVLGPWQLVPIGVLGGLAGAMAAVLVLRFAGWQTSPWAGKRPRLEWIGVGFSALILVALGVAVLAG